MNNKLLKKAIPHITAFFVLLILAVIYFLPQLEGKQMRQGDVIQYKGMAQEARAFEERTGEKTLWTNSMFGGMPTYQINTVSEGNQLKIADKMFRLFGGSDQPIGRFFTAMIGFYILLVLLGVNPWLSIAGAIAFGFTTNNLILFEAGHMTKLKSIAYLPLIVVGMLLAFRRQYLWGGLLFALGLGLNILANHVQMTYYFFLTLLIFGVAQLVYSIKRNEVPHFLKATGTLVIATAIALGSAASNLWVTYEYSKDTMRGEPILVSEKADSESKSSSETDGLAWDYAMQWSNGYIDFWASFIPGVAGGGSQEPVSENSAMYENQNWRQVLQSSGMKFPLYWGNLPFTSGPIYFGAIIVFLFIMGLWLVKEPVKWWLGLGTLLIVIFSMGYNLEAINRFFYEYVPLFNKFRTPNSALSVVAFLMPVLGFLTLGKIINGEYSKKEVKQSLLVAGGITGLICLFFILLGPSIYSFSNPGDARFEQAGLSLQPLIETRKGLMRADAFRTLILIGLTWGLIWLYNQGKFKQTYLILGVGVLVLFDMWSVGSRYVWHDDFLRSSEAATEIQPYQADQDILQDPEPSFRVYDVTQDPFRSSRASYFHQSLGGYHAAKLQRYQDIIDRHLLQGNQRVFDMLNTKYIIASPQQQGGQPIAQRNPGAIGNAWLVSQIRTVESANAEIDALNNFEPLVEAIVHQEFSDYIQGLSYNDTLTTGSIELTAYEPNHLTYESNTNRERLAVFSEIWYGPDKGWQAYIDGEPVDHIRANYVLRAMKLPAGEHKIEFIFDPKSYATGVTVSWIFSSLLLIGIVVALIISGYQYIQKLKQEPEEQTTTGKKSPPKTTATKKRLEKEKPKRKKKGKSNVKK